MPYDFLGYFKSLSAYALIDLAIVFFAVAILAVFFIYKRNVRILLILLVGVVLEIAIGVLADMLPGKALEISRYVTHYIVVFNIVVGCVVYQTDIKNVFQKVSGIRKNIELQSTDDELRAATMEILTACQDMAKKDVGAIIIIDSMGDINDGILDTGTRLDALLSAQLLESIFNTKAPLHDGAVVVRGNRIVAAGCFLTLTQRNVNKEMGTRHRAAIGVTEDTDVLSIVVSEETGIISVVKHGEIKRYMTMDKLNDEIEVAYGIAPSVIAMRDGKSKRKHSNRRFL